MKRNTYTIPVFLFVLLLVTFLTVQSPVGRSPDTGAGPVRQGEATLDREEAEKDAPTVAVPAAPPDTTLGNLRYFPPPEVTICFCGSYYLLGEEGFSSYYLVSDKHDLKLFIGKRVIVTGRKYTDICTGTLAIPCDYIKVESIIQDLSWDTEESSWGAVKSIYR
ncbi:MAG: hypothetical protein JSV33_13970 [bacterium]|nr:MAG: hypothetical protein JSV33_13970 [bacterium]